MQDKITYNASQGNQFSAIENQKADIQITIPNEILEIQTLENNQSEVLKALRNLSYNNPNPQFSWYRRFKIDFVNQNGLETTVFDSHWIYIPGTCW